MNIKELNKELDYIQQYSKLLKNKNIHELVELLENKLMEIIIIKQEIYNQS